MGQRLMRNSPNNYNFPKCLFSRQRRHHLIREWGGG